MLYSIFSHAGPAKDLWRRRFVVDHGDGKIFGAKLSLVCRKPPYQRHQRGVFYVTLLNFEL